VIAQAEAPAAPQDARLYYDSGIVACEQGDNASAWQWFNKAIELDSTWDLPRQALANLPNP
jgi:Tfp pilus assembly protein PilF